MKCGMGNWVDISSQFVKTKRAEECEQFYLGKLYVPGDQLINYKHVTLTRDITGSSNHVIDQEV